MIPQVRHFCRRRAPSRHAGSGSAFWPAAEGLRKPLHSDPRALPCSGVDIVATPYRFLDYCPPRALSRPRAVRGEHL